MKVEIEDLGTQRDANGDMVLVTRIIVTSQVKAATLEKVPELSAVTRHGLAIADFKKAYAQIVGMEPPTVQPSTESGIPLCMATTAVRNYGPRFVFTAPAHPALTFPDPVRKEPEPPPEQDQQPWWVAAWQKLAGFLKRVQKAWEEWN